MPKPASAWSFAKPARACRKAANDPVKVQELIGLFREWQSERKDNPVLYALDPRRTVGDLWVWKALAKAERDPPLAFRYFHLMLRAQALPNYVYFLRARELYALWEQNGSRGKRPALNRVGPIDLAEVTMLGAAAFALREDGMGEWFFRACLDSLERPEPYVEGDAISGGSVAPYLLRLFCFRHNQPPGPRVADVLARAGYGPYQAVFDAWERPEGLEDAFRQLADLHAWKTVNNTYPDEDGVYCLSGWLSEFPAELLLLQRVRRELGLSVPAPAHPMLNSPMARVPEEDFASGYDEYLAAAIDRVRQAGMPDLVNPWEDRFLAAGPDDPKRIILG